MPTLDSTSFVSTKEREAKVDQGVVLDKDESISETALVVSEASVQIEETDIVSVPTVADNETTSPLYSEVTSSVYPLAESVSDSVSPASYGAVSAPMPTEMTNLIHQAVLYAVESQNSAIANPSPADLVESVSDALASHIMKEYEQAAAISALDITSDDQVPSQYQTSAYLEENLTETEKEANSQMLKTAPKCNSDKNAKDILLHKFPHVTEGSAVEGDTDTSVQVQISEDTESEEQTAESETESKKGEDKTQKKNVTPIKVFLSGVARKEYSKGDYSSLVGFPPKARTPGGISRTDTVATAGVEGERSRYLAFIISSSVDHRLLSSCQLSAELKLQSLAQNIYESILSSLMRAKPERPLAGLSRSALSLDRAVFDRDKPFGRTTDMLVHSIESLLEKAKQPRSNVNLVAIFEFWNELNSLVPMSSPRMLEAKKKEIKEVNKKKRTLLTLSKGTKIISHSPSKEKETVTLSVDCSNGDTIPPLCSKLTFDLLLDILLETSSTSPKLWQLGVTLTNISIKYLAYFSFSEGGGIDCDQKLSSMFVKLFSLNFVGAEMDEGVLKSLLETVCLVQFQSRHGKGVWFGGNFLLDVLVTLLKKG